MFLFIQLFHPDNNKPERKLTEESTLSANVCCNTPSGIAGIGRSCATYCVLTYFRIQKCAQKQQLTCVDRKCLPTF